MTEYHLDSRGVRPTTRSDDTDLANNAELDDLVPPVLIVLLELVAAEEVLLKVEHAPPGATRVDSRELEAVLMGDGDVNVVSNLGEAGQRPRPLCRKLVSREWVHAVIG